MNEAMDSHPPGGGAADYPEQWGPELGSGERRRRWTRVGAVVGGIVTVSLGVVWLTRERIADSVIAGQFEAMGLPGTWRVDSVGPRRQVISHIVIGDPHHPDLTIEQAAIEIEPRLGYPAISRVEVVRPRLYGTWRNGRLSFGTLDRLLFGTGPRKQPLRLPDMALAVVDGRARVVTDGGAIGLALAGTGGLRDGFAGVLALAAPALDLGGCTVRGGRFSGQLTVAAEQPRLVGPARLDALACGTRGGARRIELGVDATADKTLDGGTGALTVAAGALGWGGVAASGLNGRADATWRNAVLSANYDVLGRGVASSAAFASTLGAKGTLRARDGFARVDLDGSIDGGGLRPGEGLASALASYEQAGQGSLIAPLLAQVRQALQREGRASRLAADLVLHRAGGRTTVVVPQGRIQGGSGGTVLALSKLQYASAPEGGTPRLAGNFMTGGAGLPHLRGRMDKGPRGDTIVTLTMADYRAGGARIAIPRLVVAQTTNGALGLSGTAVASGPLPGGRADNLVIPIEGGRTPRGVLSLWRRCATVGFDTLAYANLTLNERSVLLCPQPGGAILRSDAGGVKIAFGTPRLDLAGRLGETPIKITSGPLGFARPGSLFARDVAVELGPEDRATRFRLSDLRARVGSDISGTFAGTDVKLFAVPLDILDAAGTWRLAGGRLDLTGGTFRLQDRAQVSRFEPLRGTAASLSLAANRIEAGADLVEPVTGRNVLRVQLEHDLAAGAGRADLAVGGLTFDRSLQPAMLSRQLLGVVADVSGTVRGTGEIRWNERGVTSSGRFGTERLDLAAAFGPAKGISGTVVFTDLVNFVSAPHQRLKIASINPGIEVTDGELLFQLQPGSRLAVEGGAWPFLGGTLRLQPVDLNLGVAETRRYVLDIQGLDAARFLAQLDLANLSATGTFDGTLPLVFDQNGGRIEGGTLLSRPPGGNVSYVGALTWKDLSPIANFAFDGLKSLDYREMRIAMDGALEGNIVTRVRFDGVKQGAGAKRNFITRQFARLPLQFNVNVRAPFYQLITSFKSLYDPAYVKDPRTVGLLDAAGRPIAQPGAGPANAGKPIQPPVSGKQP